jgi:diacylglycerol kinase family enzyme
VVDRTLRLVSDDPASARVTHGEVVVLLNRNAGSSTGLTTADVRRAMQAQVAVVETRSAEAARPAAAEACHRGAKLVVVVGGDGTVTTVLSGLADAFGAESMPAIFLVPGGTMNVIARSAGAHGTPLSLLAALGHTLRGGGALRRSRHTTIRSGERLGLLWGVGLFANFLEVYQQRGSLSRALGLLASASLGALTGHSLAAKLFEPFEAKVTVDGLPWSGARWTNISAGGVAGLGFGFEPYTRATERRGRFPLIGHALGPLGALHELPRLRAGLGMKRVTQDLARHVVVETERPRLFAMDGDVFERATRFEVHAGPEIELVLPATSAAPKSR